MCDQKTTSREHVPPRCLFPELKDLPIGYDFRKNLITVPSCDIHNSEKSKDDEFLMFLFSTALKGNEHKQRHFDTKVARAYRKNPRADREFMQERSSVIVEKEDGTKTLTEAFPVNILRFNKCMHHIACGIYFDRTGCKCLGPPTVLTDAFAKIEGPDADRTHRLLQDGTRKCAEEFASLTTHGANRLIFQYKLESDNEGNNAVHLVFYEGISVAVLFRNV